MEMARVVKLAGVRYREPEQLRHTLASTLLSRNALLLYVYARRLPRGLVEGGMTVQNAQPVRLAPVGQQRPDAAAAGLVLWNLSNIGRLRPQPPPCQTRRESI